MSKVITHVTTRTQTVVDGYFYIVDGNVYSDYDESTLFRAGCYVIYNGSSLYKVIKDSKGNAIDNTEYFKKQTPINNVNKYITADEMARDDTLDSYVTNDALEEILKDYVTSDSESGTLEDYVTNDSLSTTLQDYVTNDSLSTTLQDYVTNDALTETLDTKLEDYYTSTEVDTKLGDYYTVTETDQILTNYLKTEDFDSTLADATISTSQLDGVINVDNLPATALNTCVVVENDDARLALTIDEIQTGDVVKVNDTGKLFFVSNDAALGSEDAFIEFNATVDWSTITGIPSEFTPAAHTHTLDDITDSDTLATNEAVAEQLESYYTKTEADSTFATKDDLTESSTTSDVTYATKTELSEVEDKIEETKSEIAETYSTKTELQEGLDTKQDVGDYITVTDANAAIDEKVASLNVYDLGNFDTLDAANVKLADNEVYNGLDKQVIYFSVDNTDFGIVINNQGEAIDGLPYYTKQYMYYQGKKYARDVNRSSSGLVSYTEWQLDGYNVLPDKAVQFTQLINLTSDSSDSDIQMALMPITTTSTTEAVNQDDLDVCLSTGMAILDSETSTPVIVSKPYYGTNLYTLTYVGYDNPKASTADNLGDVVSRSITLQVTDGSFSVYNPVDTVNYVREDSENLPFSIQIPIWNLSNKVYSEETILGWFGVSDIDELISKCKNTELVSMIYLNSGTMFYHMPVQMLEVTNSKNTIHLIANALDMTDDSPAKVEVTINLDGTAINDACNVKVTETVFATADSVDSGNSDLTDLINTKQDKLTAGDNVNITDNVVSVDLSEYAKTADVNTTLEDYYTKSEVDSTLESDFSNYYTKSEVDSTFATQNDVSDNLRNNYYTSTQINAILSSQYYDITEVKSLLDAKQDTLTATVGGHIVLDGSRISADLSDYSTTSEIQEKLDLKQDNLTAGDHINISGSTVSADLSDYYTSSQVNDALNLKQNVLTAGDNVSISGDTISVDLSSFSTSDAVSGALSNYYNKTEIDTFFGEYDTSAESDEKLAAKQDTLTAGYGIDITDNTISTNLDLTLFKLVSVLPEGDEIDSSKVYLIRSDESTDRNIYSEYIYVNNNWEQLGTYNSDVDLSGYVTTTDLQSDYYDKDYIDSTYTTTAGLADAYYNQGQINTLLSQYITAADVDVKLLNKQNSLVAGDYIELTDNVEAGNTTIKVNLSGDYTTSADYTAKVAAIDEKLTDLDDTKQDNLIAGTGINLADDSTISVDPDVFDTVESVDTKLTNYYTKTEINTQESSIRSDFAAADTQLSNDLETAKTEITSAYEAADDSINETITSEVSRLEGVISSGDQNVTTALEAEISAIDTAYQDADTEIKNSLTSNVETLTTTIEENYSTLDSKIDSTESSITEAYTEADTNLKTELQDTIDALSESMTSGDAAVSGDLVQAKSDLEAEIASGDAVLTDKIEEVQTNLDAAITAYTTADTKLTEDLEAAKTDLQNQINTNSGGIAELNTALTEAKESGDAALASAVEDITNKYTSGDDAVKAMFDSYYTKTDTDDLLNKKQDNLTAGTGISIVDNTISTTLDMTLFRIVDELPTENIEENKIYLKKSDESEDQNVYSEYIYTGTEWEQLGTYKAEIDLSPYLKSEDAKSTYLTIADAEDTYLTITDASGTYTTQDTFNEFQNTVTSDYALKSEIPAELPNPNALIISYNGTSVGSYDGNTSVSANLVVNADTVPVSASDSTTLKTYIDTGLAAKVDTTTLDSYKTEVTSALATKQNVLTQGDNVTISADNEISVDLSNYATIATTDSLSGDIASIKSDLTDNYVTNDSLSTTLGNYVTSNTLTTNLALKQDKLSEGSNVTISADNEISVDLSNYATIATTDSLSGDIASIKSDLTDNYVTNDSLSTTLGNYVTNDSLSGSLADYVTNSALTDELSKYTTTSDLTVQLAAKQDKLSEGDNVTINADNEISVDLSEYAKTADVNSTLESYATTQSVNDALANKQDTLIAGTGISIDENTINVTLDTTLFKVVSDLPDSEIEENKIYLVPNSNSGDSNIYIEYAYINSAWEKLGEYKADVDLSDYVTSGDLAGELEDYLTKDDASGIYVSNNTFTSALSSKQDTLTQGDNVTISASNEISVDLSNYATLEVTNGLSEQITSLESEITGKQDTLVQGSGINLSGSTISVDFSGYATEEYVSETLTDYAKSEDVATTLSSYVTSDSLSSTLEGYQKSGDYATNEYLNTELGNYVTSTALTDTLNSYLTTSGASDTYATITQLDTKQDKLNAGTGINLSGSDISVDFSGYLTSDDLSDYVTTENLTSTLNSYVTSGSFVSYQEQVSEDLAGKQNTGDYALNSTLIENYLTKTDASSTYATIESLGDYVTNDSLSGSLANYVTSSALTDELSKYTTTSDLTVQLAAKQDKLSEGDNVTINADNEISVDLSNYVTTSSLSEYAKTSEVETKLEDYLTSSGASGIYATIESLGEYAKIADVNSTLESYAKTSDLSSYLTTTDASSTYALKTDLDSKQDTLTAGTGISISGSEISVTLDTTLFKVVSALPSENIEDNKIYLLPSSTSGDSNIYVEYVYVNSAWEKLGEYKSDIDLTQYYTKTEIDAKLDEYVTSDTLAGYQESGDYVESTTLANYATIQSVTDTLADYAKLDDLSAYLKSEDAQEEYLTITNAASEYVSNDTFTSELTKKQDTLIQGSGINLSGSEISVNFSGYATEEYVADQLANYVTSGDLSTTLQGYQESGDYVTNEALGTQLQSYATTDVLDSYLTKTDASGTYALKADLDSYLTTSGASNTYATIASLDSYVTTDYLSTTLQGYQESGDYVTNTSLTSTLAGYQVSGDYVTNTALTSTLNSYLTTETAESTYAKSADLDNYATTENLSDLQDQLEQLTQAVSDLTAKIAELGGSTD